MLRYIVLLFFSLPPIQSLPVQVILSLRNAIADRETFIFQSRRWLTDGKKLFKNCSQSDVSFFDKEPGSILENPNACENEGKVFCRSIISDNIQSSNLLEFINSCAPTECSVREVEKAKAEYIKKGKFSFSYLHDSSMKYSATYCNNENHPSTGFWVTIAFSGLFFVLAIFGSILKFYSGRKIKRIEKVVGDITAEYGWKSILFNWNEEDEQTPRLLPAIIVTGPDEENLSLSCSDNSLAPEKNSIIAREIRNPSVRLSPIPFPKFKPSKAKFNSSNKNLSKIVVLKNSCSLRDLHSSTSSIEGSVGFSNQSVFVSPIHTQNSTGSTSTAKVSETPTPNPGLKFLFEMLGKVSVQNSTQKIKKKNPKEDELNFPSAKDIVFCNSLTTMALWAIMLAQFTLFFVTSPTEGTKGDLAKIFHSKVFQFLVHENVHLTTYFFSLGIGAGFHLRRSLKKRNEENNPSLVHFLSRIVSKFVDVFPLYVIIMLLWINVLPLLANGSSWYIVRANDNCYGLNWINFAYLNNFYQLSLQCMPWAWILACEFQLFSVGLLTTFLQHKVASLRKLLHPLILIGSFSISVFVAYRNNVSATSLHELFKTKPLNTSLADYIEHYSGQKSTGFELLNIKPYYQVQAYCIGSIIGCYFFLHKTIINIPAIISICMTTLLLLPAQLILAISPNLLFEFAHDGRWQFIYVLLIDKLWIISLIPLVFYLRYSTLHCFLHSLLSADIWNVFSSLNTCMILINPIVTIIFFANLDYRIHLSWFTILAYFLLLLVSSYAISFILVVFAQNPIKNFALSTLQMVWGKQEKGAEYWTNKDVRGVKHEDSEHHINRGWYTNWQRRIRSSISSIYPPEMVSKVYFPI